MPSLAVSLNLALLSQPHLSLQLSLLLLALSLALITLRQEHVDALLEHVNLPSAVLVLRLKLIDSLLAGLLHVVHECSDNHVLHLRLRVLTPHEGLNHLSGNNSLVRGLIAQVQLLRGRRFYNLELLIVGFLELLPRSFLALLAHTLRVLPL